MSGSATIISRCPHCDNQVFIDNRWTPGGVNDYGGWILKCAKCDKAFHQYVGRDIQMSRVASGASVLNSYDDEVTGSKEDALRRFGLSELPIKKLHELESGGARPVPKKKRLKTIKKPKAKRKKHKTVKKATVKRKKR